MENEETKKFWEPYDNACRENERRKFIKEAAIQVYCIPSAQYTMQYACRAAFELYDELEKRFKEEAENK